MRVFLVSLNHSSIEIIAHSSIDEKKTMCTQWSRHTARWNREESEQEAVKRRSASRHSNNVRTTTAHPPSHIHNQPARLTDHQNSHESAHGERKAAYLKNNANDVCVVLERAAHLQQNRHRGGRRGTMSRGG